MGDRVHAQQVIFGRSTGARREAPLPQGSTLIASANVVESGALWIYTRDGAMLVGSELTERGLRERFRHRLPDPCDLDPIVQADCDFIHIGAASRGLVYERLDLDGRPVERVEAHRTDVPPRRLEFDPVARRLKALFMDGGDDGHLEMLVIGPDPAEVRRQRFELQTLRARVRELDFDFDAQGRFHLLVATDRDRLDYYSHGRGPYVIAEGGSRYLPRIAAPARVYLGYFEASSGYRFLEFDRRREESRLRRELGGGRGEPGGGGE
ncbi:MAG: hypothetical protein KDC38_00980 [Planctomycetes bacterium]|nr:hypothetical protein [Planctomycetota bacterium]